MRRAKPQRGQAINPDALRIARRKAGLTLVRAADGIVTPQAFSQYELGKARPVASKLKAIAARLNVAVEDLLAGPRDPREVTMRELEQEGRWSELERLAARVLADRNITRRVQAVACYYAGRAQNNRKPLDAIEYFHLARPILIKSGEHHLAAESRDWEAAALYLLQDPSALDAAKEALAGYRMLADCDPSVEARMLEHIGNCHLQRQEIAEAQRSYGEAIDVAGQVIDLARLGNIYHGMASSCVRIGETRKAGEYFDRAVHITRAAYEVRSEVTPNLARLENDYGDFLLRTGALERAEEMITAALDHFESAGAEAARADAMLSMSDLKRQQGKLEDAIRWVMRAIDRAANLGEVVSLAVGYQQLAELAAAVGDRERAETSFSHAFEVLDQAGLDERIAEAQERQRRTQAEHDASSDLPHGC